MRKSNFKKKRSLMIALFLMIIAGVSVGYAALRTTLTINGKAKIKKAVWDIHFVNEQPLRISKDANDNDLESTVSAIKTGDKGIVIDNAAKTHASWELSLQTPGEKYVFSVDVINDGTIDGKLTSQTGTTLAALSTAAGFDLDKLFDYQVEVVTATDDNGDEVAAANRIQTGNVLKAGEKFRLKFTLTFKKDISNEDLEAFNTKFATDLENGGKVFNMDYQLDYEQA